MTTVFQVESASIPGKFYEVDTEKHTCTCPFFQFNKHKICPHMRAVGMSESVPVASGYDWLALHDLNSCGSGQDLKALILSYDKWLRTPVSKNFILRDFMFSAFGSVMGIHNLPENPDMVLASAKALCERVCEPILERWGEFSITYGYSSRKLMQAEWPNLGPKQSSPHNWDRGTFGKQIYARIDILPVCVENGTVTKEEFAEWMMMVLDIDLLMQWDKSNVLCVTISPQPRRVWLKWVPQGKGEGGSNKITYWGEKFWQETFHGLTMKPKFGPSATDGKMYWKK